MLEVFAGIIFAIGIIFIFILLYSFGKRILQLELIIIEIAKELNTSSYISKVSVDHILRLSNEISNIDVIKESKDQTLN